MEFRTQAVARQLVVTLLAMLALTEGVWAVAHPGNRTDSGVQSHCVAQRRHGNKAEIARQDHLENRVVGRSGGFDSRPGRESRRHHGCKG